MFRNKPNIMMLFFSRANLETWVGQNKRNGSIGRFPQSLLLPHETSDKKPARSEVKSVALIQLEENASSVPPCDANLVSKSVTMAGWTTFESTTDLTSSTQTQVQKDDNVIVKQSIGDQNKLVCNHSVKDDTWISVPDKMSSREVDLQSVEIDVSDREHLLPAPSVTSLSEPCSPAHLARNQQLLSTAKDNLSYDDHDGEPSSRSGPFCRSLPGGKGTDRLAWTSSASCENLNAAGSPMRPAGQSLNAATAHFSEHLCKASSDSTVYVENDHAAGRVDAPPVPPRDYPRRGNSTGSSRNKNATLPQLHPVIHPILQDGKQRSNTHYWLLPEKMRLSEPVPSFLMPEDAANHSPYINMSDGQWHGRSISHPQAKPLPRSASDTQAMVDAVESRPAAADEESHASLREAYEKIDRVRLLLGVESVSSDEVLTALTGHQWSVENAVEYLKVEHLFRLGIASRPVCRAVLLAHRWDLEPAASALLDRCGNH